MDVQDICLLDEEEGEWLPLRGGCFERDDDQTVVEGKKANRVIEKNLEEDYQQDLRVIKLLLLGAGESGKSTLFKQMITIYGTGFSEEDRKTLTPNIWRDVIQNMWCLCEQSQKFSPVVDPECKEAFDHFAALQSDEFVLIDSLSEQVGGYIEQLWADPNIQATYAKRSQFQISDGASHFFDKIKEVCSDSYVPTQEDVLRVRVRTTGIVENKFTIGANRFMMFDVGGQRNERKKWIHCFENVTAVLFVAAISAYDQVLWEDEKTNRMHEALALFGEICNSRWFKKTAMMLFLNKRDLFAEKVENTSIRCCFPDYTGPDEYDDCADYIQQQFRAQNKAPKQVYIHITCATDTNNVQIVFNLVKDTIIRKSLQDAELV